MSETAHDCIFVAFLMTLPVLRAGLSIASLSVGTFFTHVFCGYAPGLCQWHVSHLPWYFSYRFSKSEHTEFLLWICCVTPRSWAWGQDHFCTLCFSSMACQALVVGSKKYLRGVWVLSLWGVFKQMTKFGGGIKRCFSNVLATQASRSEFVFSAPTLKAKMVWQDAPVILVLGMEQRQEDPCCSLDSQSQRIIKTQVQWRSCVKKWGRD